jgi:hypothetical protein
VSPGGLVLLSPDSVRGAAFSEDGAAHGSSSWTPALAESTPAHTMTFPPLVKGGPGGVGPVASSTQGS